LFLIQNHTGSINELANEAGTTMRKQDRIAGGK
jgi:hypothetical protein